VSAVCPKLSCPDAVGQMDWLQIAKDRGPVAALAVGILTLLEKLTGWGRAGSTDYGSP
jgi:hypothetical protein